MGCHVTIHVTILQYKAPGNWELIFLQFAESPLQFPLLKRSQIDCLLRMASSQI